MPPHTLYRRVYRLVALVLLFATLLVPSVGMSAAPTPVYAAAVVDGNPGEWNLATDFFVDLHQAGHADKPVLAKLYLRYHCPTNVLYALVLPVAPHKIVANGSDAFLKLGNSIKLVDGNAGNNGIAPDFEWIGLSGGYANGWEASAPLAVGNYPNLNPHTNVDDNETAAAIGRSVALELTCPPLAVDLASFEATARPADILVEWETSNESDNLGFNLYRSASPYGERVRLNAELIPSQAPGGGGAAYEWRDGTVTESSSYFYWLETVDFEGAAEIHGPVSAAWGVPTAVTLGALDVTTPAPSVLRFAAIGILLAGVTFIVLHRAARR